ncbi:MAG: hypothetical protein QOJ13_2353 [Gaiellales bacterium]|jgi:signal transduction histidine kinase|nr:hypothetical protein [Gaiellales bacterium]
MDARLDSDGLDETRLRRLLEVGRTLASELELESVLASVLEAARDLTGARYAALGVLNEGGDILEQFLTRGIDEATHQLIGDLPRGHGVLGVLISDPQSLRLSEVGNHPQSYGFPAGHPPMSSFLGVPIRIRDEVYGNLYLTEKDGGDFDAADEQAVLVLAEWAGAAIHNARLYRDATERRDELQRAVSAFEASLAVALAVGGETELGRILELIVKRGRALIDARSMFIALESGGALTINAVAGELDRSLEQRVVPLAGSVAAAVMERRQPLHLGGDPAGPPAMPVEGIEGTAALIMPLVYRGESVGVLCALDPLDAAKFSQETERVLKAFASSGATAVATGRNVAEQRLKRGIEASENERRRWARELHDETLQDMASLKLILSSARRSKDPAVVADILNQAVEQITAGIASLRRLINDLRPPVLDNAGVRPALEALVARVASSNPIDVQLHVDLAYASGAETTRLHPQVEDTLYRVVQEALTNVLKHADATSVAVSVVERGDHVELLVRDNGIGIGETEGPSGGFGLVGIRERVELVGGSFAVGEYDGGGTELRATIPATRQQEPALPGG